MNKIQKWFYEKNKKRVELEVEDRGLMIKDEEKFHAHIKKLSKRNIMYNIIFLGLIIYIILKWVGVLK